MDNGGGRHRNGKRARTEMSQQEGREGRARAERQAEEMHRDTVVQRVSVVPVERANVTENQGDMGADDSRNTDDHEASGCVERALKRRRRMPTAAASNGAGVSPAKPTTAATLRSTTPSRAPTPTPTPTPTASASFASPLRTGKRPVAEATGATGAAEATGVAGEATGEATPVNTPLQTRTRQTITTPPALRPNRRVRAASLPQDGTPRSFIGSLVPPLPFVSSASSAAPAAAPTAAPAAATTSSQAPAPPPPSSAAASMHTATRMRPPSTPPFLPLPDPLPPSVPTSGKVSMALMFHVVRQLMAHPELLLPHQQQSRQQQQQQQQQRQQQQQQQRPHRRVWSSNRPLSSQSTFVAPTAVVTDAGTMSQPATTSLAQRIARTPAASSNATAHSSSSPSSSCATTAAATATATDTATSSSAVGTDDNSATGSGENTVSVAAHPTRQSSSTAKSSKKSKRKGRCSVCRARLRNLGFDCRCGGVFCSDHRYAETHKCSHDYATEHRRFVRDNNPNVTPRKLQKA